MNVINVGFNSKYWNILVEASDDYKGLSTALDNDDAKVATAIMNTIYALMSGGGSDNDAYKSAHRAIQASNGMDVGLGENTQCPFCHGEGIVYYDIENGNAPWETKEEWGSCNACGGNGVINSADLFSTFAEHSLPEHVVMSVIKGDVKSATDIAKEVMREILSHEDDNLDKSIEDAS